MIELTHQQATRHAQCLTDLFSLFRITRLLSLFVFILGVQRIHAGSATWSQSPASGDWNEPNNWVPATVPNGPADVATFGASNLTSISISENFEEQVNGITFNPGASGFTITIAEPAGSCCPLLRISGVGIVNTSGITQNFVSNSTFAGRGIFLFAGNSTAGSSTVFTNNGAGIGTFDPHITGVLFVDTATAGSGVFINNPGLVSEAMPGSVSFKDNATAGRGTFTNNGSSNTSAGPSTSFWGSATAGEGSFINNGATGPSSQFYNGGITSFHASTSAANATFTNNGGPAASTVGGVVFFRDNSTAANGTFTNRPGVSNANPGHTSFLEDAAAGHGVFTNEGGSFSNQFGGYVRFTNNASAANSTILNGGAMVSDTTSGVTYFDDNSTASNAILQASSGLNAGSGGRIEFTENSTGGTSQVVLLGNGSLTISARNPPGVTIGSLEGSGNALLGNNNLTVGSRNNSTNFSGVIQDGGSLTKIGTGTLTLSGVNTYTGATTINGGELVVDGSITSGVTVTNGGALAGSGTTGSVTVNSGGSVAPGGSQTLHINGNYAQNAGGLLKIEVPGTAPNASGHLDISGSATVDGTLEVRFMNGLLPIWGQVIEVLHVGGAFAGSFAQIIFPDLRAGFQFHAEFVNGIYQITALNDGVAAVGFLNISTRMRVGTGDNALIGGFIVTAGPSTTGSGPSGATKKVIIRAIGPSLAPLPGRLADPTLELRDNAGALLLSNDNWVESPQAQEIIDSTIPPTNDLEAAIVATLAPGSYTAVMRGANNTNGIGVVEVYDLTPNAPASLANISSRGLVETGDNVMIGGFIVDNQASHVIVRALGPSLTPFGIPNALADPTLTLHNGDGAIIAFNDDWQEANQAAIEATGIPPTHAKESSILATLAPGPHTAIVRGQNETTGVGLVEVYKLP